MKINHINIEQTVEEHINSSTINALVSLAEDKLNGTDTELKGNIFVTQARDTKVDKIKEAFPNLNIRYNDLILALAGDSENDDAIVAAAYNSGFGALDILLERHALTVNSVNTGWSNNALFKGDEAHNIKDLTCYKYFTNAYAKTSPDNFLGERLTLSGLILPSGTNMLETIEIPEGIEVLGTSLDTRGHCISHCPNLKSIKFPSTLRGLANGSIDSNNPALEHLDELDFTNTQIEFFGVPNSEVSLGVGFWCFSYNRFTGCNITSVKLPQNCKLVCVNGWPNAVDLPFANLADNVILGQIRNNSKIAWTHLPNQIRCYNPLGLHDTGIILTDTISNNCFLGSTKLALVDLPELIKNIQSSAFEGCTSLALATLPTGLENIGNNAFKGCSNITISLLPNTLITLGDAAFRDCSNITIDTVPGSITSIGATTFLGCTSITSFNTNNVTSIGNSAFLNCSNMTSITMPNVTSIGNSAFLNCSKLVLTSLPVGLTDFSVKAFDNCPLVNITSLPDTITNLIGDHWAYRTTQTYSLYNSSFILTSGQDIEALGNTVFEDSNIKVEAGGIVTLKNNQTILPNAFKNNSLITKVIGGKIDTSINIENNNNADYYRDCINLLEIDWSQFTTSIPNGCFYGCKTLTSVTIPSTIIRIRNNAFSNCTALTKIIFSGGTCNIDSCFNGCNALTLIDMKDSFTYTGSPFSNLTANCTLLIRNSTMLTTAGGLSTNKVYTIYVPDSLVSNYTSSSVWNKSNWTIKPLSEYVE